MDRILFGDNQFFGVNHMSEEKARAQSMRFQELDSVIRVLDTAHELGVRTFMCTTHDRIAEVCEHMRAHPAKYQDYRFYPCMPYAHKYANAVTEDGVLGALRRFMPGNALGVAARGGIAIAKQDYIGIMKLLVDAELKMFQGLRTDVIFLQNILVDLLLGLGMRDVFVAFAEYVQSKYDAEPGFITMNLPALLDMLEGTGIENPIVCSSINKLGFRMSGGKALYEETLRDREFRAIAMMVLAAGALPPREAIDYVCSQEQIQSIVFGASSRTNIEETVRLIQSHPWDTKGEGLELQPQSQPLETTSKPAQGSRESVSR